MMFDESAYHAGGSLRPKGELAAAAVLKDIHLFLDHVRAFSQRPLEKVQRFKGGGADFLVPETMKKLAGGSFQAFEQHRFGGKDIFGTADRLVLGHRRKL